MLSLLMGTNSATTYRIEKGSEAHRLSWMKLRRSLWPHASQEDHARDIAKILDASKSCAAFVSYAPNGECIAFAEAAIRRDYVNGCKSTPVAFLEGIFVHPAHRKTGNARALCIAVEGWATSKGCAELASAADLGNVAGHQMHGALGFIETERVVFFRKPLSRKS
jgi:aminoglycoside 6'-N-acetyltransferase I